MSDELKPCPFCGATAKVTYLDYKNGTTDARMVRCSSSGDCSTLEEHPASVWNTRPIEDTLRARIAALKRVVEAAKTYNDAMPDIQKGWEPGVESSEKAEFFAALAALESK